MFHSTTLYKRYGITECLNNLDVWLSSQALVCLDFTPSLIDSLILWYIIILSPPIHIVWMTFLMVFPDLNVVLVQFYNAPINEFQAKLVLKPLAPDRRWKFMYEPIHQDVRLLSKKIPVTKFLNLQVWCFYIPFSVYKEYKCIYIHTHTHREREREAWLKVVGFSCIWAFTHKLQEI